MESLGGGPQGCAVHAPLRAKRNATYSPTAPCGAQCPTLGEAVKGVGGLKTPPSPSARPTRPAKLSSRHKDTLPLGPSERDLFSATRAFSLRRGSSWAYLAPGQRLCFDKGKLVLTRWGQEAGWLCAPEASEVPGDKWRRSLTPRLHQGPERGPLPPQPTAQHQPAPVAITGTCLLWMCR